LHKDWKGGNDTVGGRDIKKQQRRRGKRVYAHEIEKRVRSCNLKPGNRRKEGNSGREKKAEKKTPPNHEENGGGRGKMYTTTYP